MSSFVTSLEGTAAGHTAAMLLALTAAFLHAVFGALQKGRIDPWLTRGAIDFWLIVLTLPIALFVVPWPQGWEWLIVGLTLPIHFAYKLGQAMAYTRGAYTVVYPVVRGTSPLVTVFAAALVFGEVFAPMQWLGLAILLAGILGLAAYNLVHIKVDRDTLVPALWLAVLTGALVALYTTYDAWGIRALPDPFTFLAWFFVISSLDFPIIAARRWRRLAPADRPPLAAMARRGALGAVVAWGSFGSVMLATRLDQVGEAAVLRETSTVFAAVIGWLVMREPVGWTRAALMGLIAAGAVVVEFGG